MKDINRRIKHSIFDCVLCGALNRHGINNKKPTSRRDRRTLRANSNVGRFYGTNASETKT